MYIILHFVDFQIDSKFYSSNKKVILLRLSISRLYFTLIFIYKITLFYCLNSYKKIKHFCFQKKNKLIQ